MLWKEPDSAHGKYSWHKTKQARCCKGTRCRQLAIPLSQDRNTVLTDQRKRHTPSPGVLKMCFWYAV